MRQRRKTGLPPLDANMLATMLGGLDAIEAADAPAVTPSPDAAGSSQPEKAGSKQSGGGCSDVAATATTDGNDDDSPRCADSEVDLIFSSFPGGLTTLRSIVRYLEVSAAEERAAAAAAGQFGVPAGVLKVDPAAFHIDFNTESIGIYLEAAAVLRCPRILRETVLAPAAKELPSRRVFALLESFVRFTVDAPIDECMPSEGRRSRCSQAMIGVLAVQGGSVVEAGAGTTGASGDNPQEQPSAINAAEEPDDDKEESDKDEEDDFISRTQVVQAFCQVIQRLCARLDAVDFKLSANLGVGSPWASVEVLKAYRVKVENMNRVNYALQSMVTSTAKLFFYEEEKNANQPKQQEWKEHHFALHVFRKHVIESTLYSRDPKLRGIAEKAFLDRHEVDVKIADDMEFDDSLQRPDNPEDAEDDIPDAICDCVPSACLATLATFVSYCEPMQTPPVLAATMVRALLLTDQVARARLLFEAIFVRSRKAQSMVIAGQIPVDFLCSVKGHRSASIVLRKLLGRHELHGRAELCHLLDHVVLEEFRNEKHCHDLILSNVVARDLTVYCRVSTSSVAALEDRAPEDLGLCPGTSGEAEMLRLRKVGERLFAAVFVMHFGFLPASEEESSERHGLSWIAAECPWDSGDLDLPLLHHVGNNEDALHLSRRVLLRGLLRRQRAGVESDVPTTVRLWTLGRWPSCRDAVLISEAFAFLSSCWKNLRSQRAVAVWPGVKEVGALSGDAAIAEHGEKAAVAAAKAICNVSSDRLYDMEALFRMFSDLEFWRLPSRDLLTPWVPPHLLACHISQRCKQLDEHQRTLSEENRQNLQEINRLRQTVRQLFAKLEAVDARSVHCMEKQSEVSDTLRSLR